MIISKYVFGTITEVLCFPKKNEELIVHIFYFIVMGIRKTRNCLQKIHTILYMLTSVRDRKNSRKY